MIDGSSYLTSRCPFLSLCSAFVDLFVSRKSEHDSMSKLPDEILAMIFKKCKPREIHSLLQTSRRFYKVLATPRLFNGLDVLAMVGVFSGKSKTDFIKEPSRELIVSCFNPDTRQIVTAPHDYNRIGKIYSFGSDESQTVSPVCVRQIHYDPDKKQFLFCLRHHDIQVCDASVGRLLHTVTTTNEIGCVTFWNKQTYFTSSDTVYRIVDTSAVAFHTFPGHYCKELFFTKSGKCVVTTEGMLLFQNGAVIEIGKENKVAQIQSKDWIVAANPQKLAVYDMVAANEVYSLSTDEIIDKVDYVSALGVCEQTDRIFVSFRYEIPPGIGRSHIAVWDLNQRSILASFAPCLKTNGNHFGVKQILHIAEFNYIVTCSFRGVEIWDYYGTLLKRFQLTHQPEKIYLDIARQELVVQFCQGSISIPISQRISWESFTRLGTIFSG